MTDPVTWRHDATTSRTLRVLAHGAVVAIGGWFLLLAGLLLVALPPFLVALDTGTALFVALLVLVGGPFSLLYLWPMLTDPDQRPPLTAFTFDDERVPWTKRSFVAAAVAGVVAFAALGAAGVPFGVLFGGFVAALCSPVLVAVFASEGAVEAETLRCNGSEVSLAQVTGVRALRVGGATLVWMSYARGTGALVPRLLTVPSDRATAVRAAVERGVDRPSETPTTRPLVRTILGATGVGFFGVAALAARGAGGAVGLYLGGVVGLLGALFCVAAWRGVGSQSGSP